mmetsp:Transcript_51377/g.135496  ORF Transcript_51377/g.135496 Transcript_51377/m.135496 type:complete len:937 (-) Transcript_51377:45-2855(-)
MSTPYDAASARRTPGPVSGSVDIVVNGLGNTEVTHNTEFDLEVLGAGLPNAVGQRVKIVEADASCADSPSSNVVGLYCTSPFVCHPPPALAADNVTTWPGVKILATGAHQVFKVCYCAGPCMQASHWMELPRGTLSVATTGADLSAYTWTATKAGLTTADTAVDLVVTRPSFSAWAQPQYWRLKVVAAAGTCRDAHDTDFVLPRADGRPSAVAGADAGRWTVELDGPGAGDFLLCLCTEGSVEETREQMLGARAVGPWSNNATVGSIAAAEGWTTCEYVPITDGSQPYLSIAGVDADTTQTAGLYSNHHFTLKSGAPARLTVLGHDLTDFTAKSQVGLVSGACAATPLFVAGGSPAAWTGADDETNATQLTVYTAALAAAAGRYRLCGCLVPSTSEPHTVGSITTTSSTSAFTVDTPLIMAATGFGANEAEVMRGLAEAVEAAPGYGELPFTVYQSSTRLILVYKQPGPISTTAKMYLSNDNTVTATVAANGGQGSHVVQSFDLTAHITALQGDAVDRLTISPAPVTTEAVDDTQSQTLAAALQAAPGYAALPFTVTGDGTTTLRLVYKTGVRTLKTVLQAGAVTPTVATTAAYGGYSASSTGGTTVGVCADPTKGYSRDLGMVTVTARADVGIDWVFDPEALEQSVEVTGYNLNNKDRIMVIPHHGTCGVTPPTPHLVSPAHDGTAAAFNHLVPMGMEAPAPAEEAVGYDESQGVFCAGANLRTELGSMIEPHRCGRKCGPENTCSGPTCFCDGYFAGVDSVALPPSATFDAAGGGIDEFGTALCLPRAECVRACDLLGSACGSIDMHASLPRCHLNPPECPTPVVDANYTLLTKRQSRQLYELVEGSSSSALKFAGLRLDTPGTFKVCFCDSDFGACTTVADYSAEIGTIHASKASCMLAEPRFRDARCYTQYHGGVACGPTWQTAVAPAALVQ